MLIFKLGWVYCFIVCRIMKRRLTALEQQSLSSLMIIDYGIVLEQHYQTLEIVCLMINFLDEAAIEAYDRVLQLKPNFVRGRYNLGVSCMNIGCYKEAAEHFLNALSLHVNPADQGGPVVNISSTIWDTLYRTFVMVVYFLLTLRWTEEIGPTSQWRKMFSFSEKILNFKVISESFHDSCMS
jgi:tetratricopeptide (TPR) repeat protein